MTGGRQRLVDRLYVLLLGAGIAALAWAWSFDAPPPDMVDDLAAAAGLRPPTSPFGLHWQYVAVPLCRVFGVQAAETVLRVAGHVSLALLALIACAFFEMLTPETLRRGEHVATWWRAMVRFVLFQGVVLFCCADPVWNAFRWFTPVSLHVLVAASALLLFVSHFKSLRRAQLFAAFALLGFLAADTPVGAILTVAVIVALRVRTFLRAAGKIPTPEENPLADSLIGLRLTLAYGAGFVVGAFLEIRMFNSMDALAAFGWSGDKYAFELPFAYVKSMLKMCSTAGVILFFGIAVLPVAIAYELIRRAADDERHLAYVYGATFVVFGLIAFSQLSGASQLWFWTWCGESVRDGVLKCIAVFLCALSAIWSLAMFMLELFLRNFRRIETLRFPDAVEEAEGKSALARAERLRRIVRVGFLVEPVLVLACVLPFRMQRTERSMLGLVAAVVRETAEECRDVEFLFTDGGLDAAVELAAAAEGRRLRTLSVMGGAADARDIYLRTRGVEDPVDKALLGSGATDALRTWVRTRSDKLKSVAVQIGFELWRRDGFPMPECSGLVARPEGLLREEASRGAEVARELARWVLALYAHGSPDAIVDRPLKDAFLFAQWRLAVLARHRANAYDERGEKELAMEDTRLADELDKNNGALARIRATMAWASRKKLERMTPQEGLRLGLSRADFARARVFALKVLDITPDDPAANFALGMDFFVQKQYARAEAYLTRCLVHRPNDPAVLNNLAQCRLRQGDFKGAMPYAKRALEALPDSPEVKRTIERIEEGMKQGFLTEDENEKKEGEETP